MSKPSVRDEVLKIITDDPSKGRLYVSPQEKAVIAKEYLRNKRVRQVAEDVNEANRRGWITLSKEK